MNLGAKKELLSRYFTATMKPTTQKLSDYLGVPAMSYFYHFSTRLLIANELINTIHDLLTQDPGLVKYLAFLNADLLTLNDDIQNGGDGVDAFPLGLDWPALEGLDEESPFTNYFYYQRTLFFKKKKPIEKFSFDKRNKRFHQASVKNILSTFGAEDVAHLVATLLFEVVFGAHPLLGRQYYQNLVVSPESDLAFFCQHPRFIFDSIDSNPNRFVNGYHSRSWFVWRQLSASQQRFFIDVLTTSVNFDTLYRGWHREFDFTPTFALTPCGENLPALVFDNGHQLVVGRHLMGVTIRCNGFRDNLKNKCSSCSFPPEQRRVSIIVSRVLVRGPGKEQRSLMLFKGFVVVSRMLFGQGLTPVFEAIISKKGDLLGLKYLGDQEIEATQGDKQRKFKKDETIPLFPGTIIKIADITIEVEGGN